MGRKSDLPLEQRVEAVLAVLRKDEPLSVIARRYQVSCGNRIRPESVEAVDDPLLVARILLALGLYGRAPARAPSRTGSGLFDDVGQCTYEEDD